MLSSLADCSKRSRDGVLAHVHHRHATGFFYARNTRPSWRRNIEGFDQDVFARLQLGRMIDQSTR
jgi:hypothetical protein